MKKLIKLIASLFTLVLVTCVGMLGILVYVIDLNDLKPLITKHIAQQSGYQIQIDGPLTWSLLPTLTLHAGHIRLSAPNRNTPFLDALEVDLKTSPATLLGISPAAEATLLFSHARLIKMNLQKVTVKARWQDGMLTLNPIHAFLYQGELHGTAIGQSFNSIPKWQWNMEASNVEVKSFLQDINGDESKISIGGRGQLQLQAESQGRHQEELVSQLNGTGNFSLLNGALGGIDLNYLIHSANAFINQSDQMKLDNQHQTFFNKLSGSFLISNGEAETNNLLMLADAFATKAKGTVGLLSRNLNFELKVKALPAGKIDWRIPVLVDGTLEHPNIRLDTMEIQKLLASDKIDNLKEKAADQIQKHLHGKTADLLLKLLR